MSKISALPVAGPLDGSETVPMVQEGETVRGNIGDHIGSLAQPYIEQVIAARDITQAAVGVNYINEAAALSGAVEGEKFKYWNGDNIVFAEKEDGLIKPLTGEWFDRDKVGEKTVAELLASTEGPRGPGSRWNAGGYRYEEVDPGLDLVGPDEPNGYHVITEGGVKLRVLRSHGAHESAAFGILPNSNNKDALTAALFAAAGSIFIFSNIPVVPFAESVYRANALPAFSNSQYYFEPGVRVYGLGTGENADSTIFKTYYGGSENILISGYGAVLQAHNDDRSHALNLGNYPQNVTVEGLTVIGPGLSLLHAHESDAIYIGGIPDDNLVAKNIVLRDVVSHTSRRNIVSVVGCHGFLGDNCDFSGTIVGAVFRKIVDFEANRYMANGDHAVKSCTLRKSRIHDSADTGVLVSWSTEITIDDCDIWNCVKYAVHCTPGGNIFNADRNRRPGDALGVISFNTATGWIKVSTGDLLTDDLGIHPGVYCARATRNAGAWPTEISSGFYIEDISADQLSIRVSVVWGFMLTSFAGSGSAGSGSLSEDPDASSLWMGVYRTDDAVTIFNSRAWGCGDHCINIAGSGVNASLNRLSPGAGKTGINIQAARDIAANDNNINGMGLALRGITIGSCAGFASNDNTIYGTTLAGIAAIGCTGAELNGDKVNDCAFSGSTEGPIYVNNAKRVKVTGAVLRNSSAKPSLYGLRTGSSAENCLFTRVDATTSGSSNGSSLSISPGTGNRKVDCWQRDGAFAA